jgi:hypothetical protein
MQEVFQKFSELAVESDKRALKILDDLVQEKRLGISKKTSAVIDLRNIDTIYNLIEESGHLSKEDEDEDS